MTSLLSVLQRVSITASLPVYRFREPFLTGRIIALVAVLIVEVIAVSLWLDTSALNGRNGLTQKLGDWAPGILRAFIVFTFAWSVVSYIRHGELLRTLLRRYEDDGLKRRYLVSHAVGMAMFAIASTVLFGSNISGRPADLLSVLTITTGGLAALSAIFAVVPPAACFTVLQSTRQVILCAVVASLLIVYALPYANERAWRVSSQATFNYVEMLLRPIVGKLSTDSHARIIKTSKFGISISPQCSGIEGVSLLLAFLAIWLVVLRREYRFPHVLILIPVGIVTMWALNGVRIAALFLIGHWGAASVAAGGFHSQAGWIAFNAVAIGLLLAARRLPWLLAIPSDAVRQKKSSFNPAAPYLVPFLAIISTAMIAGAATAGEFNALYPVRLIAAVLALVFFRQEYARLDWRCGWWAPGAGIVVFAVWMALAPSIQEAGQGTKAALEQMPAIVAAGWIAVRVLASVVTVPVAEELAFRAFLIRRVMGADFDSMSPRAFSWLAVVVSSVAFGLLHGEWWLPGVIAGGIYAAVYLHRGRIGDAVMAHAVTNALVAFQVIQGGQWGLW